MNKQEFIQVFDNFCSNIELEYIDITGQIKNIVLDKLLKTTDINLNDLPFDTLEKIFYTQTQFYKIDNEYETVIDNIPFKTYDKIYINNTYVKFIDYLFFKKYFNINLSDINIFYPVKIINKKDFTDISSLFNITILYNENITFSNNSLAIYNNKISVTIHAFYNSTKPEIYKNYYYNFYQECSLFNLIKYFIYGLLEYKQIEENIYNNIPTEKIEISKIDENIDKTVSLNMINRIEYNNISQEELLEEIKPIPSKDLYENEQHIILQGIFEDIQKFCNNIEKYIAGANWQFDKDSFKDFDTIDKKIEYLETVLKNYNNNKLDMRGYNSYFRSVKRTDIVGDSDNLNYVNLTESENNFLHIEKILQSNKYPLFAKLNLISQLKNTINLYLNTIKTLYDNKKFYNEDTTEQLLPKLRQSYYELAKAVASQEQPASFGNPSFDDNPNENPFRQELP